MYALFSHSFFTLFFSKPPCPLPICSLCSTLHRQHQSASESFQLARPRNKTSWCSGALHGEKHKTKSLHYVSYYCPFSDPTPTVNCQMASIGNRDPLSWISKKSSYTDIYIHSIIFVVVSVPCNSYIAQFWDIFFSSWSCICIAPFNLFFIRRSPHPS